MIKIKQNDTGIGIKATLYNNEGSINLTDTNVSFLFGSHNIKPIIQDSENGEVIVVFNQEHTSKSGYFTGEFKVRFKDGRRESFPTESYIKINIV